MTKRRLRLGVPSMDFLGGAVTTAVLMSSLPPTDPPESRATIPYATPSAGNEIHKTLGAVAMVFAAACFGILVVMGVSWQTVAVIGILAVVVIAYGFFITRR